MVEASIGKPQVCGGVEKMTDVQRALLGDRAAAERLTEAGVLLPCPWCGGKAKIILCDDEGNHHADEYESDPWSGLGFMLCHDERDNTDCVIAHKEGYQLGRWIYDTRKEAIRAWNTRARLLTDEQMERLEEIE